jgi:TusA-related sulfurtransferase
MQGTPMQSQNGTTFSQEPNNRLDITGYICPMTFVKTKLYLEDMSAGETLGLKIRLGESYNNVTRSLRDEGHKLLAERPVDEHVVELLIEKGKD